MPKLEGKTEREKVKKEQEMARIQINDNEYLASTEPLKGLRKLTHIGLSNIDTVDLEILSDLPELRSMSLVNIKEVNYGVLLKMKLEYLEIDCNDNEEFLVICQMKTLKNLRLHGLGYWNEETQSFYGFTSIQGIEQLESLTNLDLLLPGCYDISPISSLNIETLEIQLPEECDLTPLKGLSSLKTVIVPVYEIGNDSDNLMLEKVKALLPDIEVKDSKY